MNASECQLASKAVCSLKCRNEWFYEDDLFETRADYFFASDMMNDMEEMVFPTSVLFLRDILENRKISPYLHDPIVFVSKAIAFYLLKEYQLHLIVKAGSLNSTSATCVGGLMIFEESVEITPDYIVGIKINEMNRESILRDINQITLDSDMRICNPSLKEGA